MFKRERKIKRVIEKYKEELRKLGINVEKVILYGSYANGTFRKDSDIDLAVISEDFEDLNLRERLEILGLAAGRVFEPIEAFGYTQREIELGKEESFVAEILNGAIAY